MKLPPFTVHRPGSVGQASRLLADLGDDAAAYCGGTELLLAMKLGLASYEHLVDLKRVYGLRGIAADGGMTRIGAATTHHEIETSAPLRARYPEMSAMISQVANLRVRAGRHPGRQPVLRRPALRPGLVPDGGGRDARLPAGRGDPPRAPPPSS